MTTKKEKNIQKHTKKRNKIRKRREKEKPWVASQAALLLGL